ncbi:endopeptidase [Streptomyces anulatus]|uniref:Endopeptidase n=1 Tax=Streptomyces anulatus TaxID=1892 RepID=A0ABZ1ZAU7_STRAQ|nr:endopeptidase [Streptomyces anulatus]
MEQQHIVGVHGIKQGRTSRRELIKDWNKALNRGITALHGQDVVRSDPRLIPTLEIPHWSSLLARGADRLGPSDFFPDDSTALTADEEAFIVEAMDDLLTPQERALAEELDPTTLGLPKLPPSVTRRAMVYDRRTPDGVVGKLITRLREVRFYLKHPNLASEVQEHVVKAFSDDTATVVIGHSLGSVIAYDLIRQEQIAAPGTAGTAVHTFVTCGTPLGIPAVRRAMNIPEPELLAMPAHIKWLNVYDPDDVVTGAAGLALGARNVTDVEVDNGNIDPHAAQAYLRTIPVARAATRSLP